jgi:hypothetical protein
VISSDTWEDIPDNIRDDISGDTSSNCGIESNNWEFVLKDLILGGLRPFLPQGGLPSISGDSLPYIALRRGPQRADLIDAR